MKAPDKICVAPHQIFDYDLEIQEVGHNGAEEYIRKKALMEWATNLKERWKEPPVSVHSPGCVYMLEQVIDKLNSM